MNQLKLLFQRRERVFLLLILSIALTIMYFGAHMLAQDKPPRIIYWDPVWHLPFINAFIVPYLSLFIMPFFFFATAAQRNFFRRWIATVLITAFVSVWFFVFWPLFLPLPPLSDDNLFSWLTALTYTMDVRGNFFPSQHVILAFLMAFALGHERPNWRRPMLFWASIISISTVFVRQHYVIDVVIGLIMALLAWSILLRFNR
jgi:membrane-associated phospholipid phosphatase